MTTETYPERFYSLSIKDNLGKEDPSSRAYVSGLMSISARRSLKNNETTSKNYLNPKQRLGISKQIDDHMISESNVFYLKSYIKKYYPEMLKSINFKQV